MGASTIPSSLVLFACRHVSAFSFTNSLDFSHVCNFELFDLVHWKMAVASLRSSPCSSGCRIPGLVVTSTFYLFRSGAGIHGSSIFPTSRPFPHSLHSICAVAKVATFVFSLVLYYPILGCSGTISALSHPANQLQTTYIRRTKQPRYEYREASALFSTDIFLAIHTGGYIHF